MASSSQQPPPKRHRAADGVIERIVGSRLAIAPQVVQHSANRNHAYDELHKWDRCTTPCGDLITELSVSTASGIDLKIPVLNPFALLWRSTSMSIEMSSFLQQHLGGKVCRICLYCDGVTPGNALRPDKGRTFEAVYWTFLELPDWFRSHVDVGWMPLCFVESKKMDAVLGGMSAVVKAIVRLFSLSLMQP